MTDSQAIATIGAAASIALPVLSPQQAVAALTQRHEIIQTVMREVMRKDVDYGQIPGTQGLSLYKPGAEKLGVVFGLAPRYDVTDLGENGEITYRVTAELFSRETGLLLGSGLGECTSLEEKYAWRRASSKAEYEATPADRRRIKHGGKKGGGSYEVEQVRQDPANVRHTVLSQASKRALVAATRAVTGCSDMFADGAEGPTAASIVTGPGMLRYLLQLAEQKGISEDEVISKLAAKGHEGPLASLPYLQAESFVRWLSGKPDAVAGETAAEEADDADVPGSDDFEETEEIDEGQQSLDG